MKAVAFRATLALTLATLFIPSLPRAEQSAPPPIPQAKGDKGSSLALKLHWLDQTPSAPEGVSWGVPWPKGTVKPETDFKLADAKVKMDLKTALSDKLIIEEILIDGPEITYESGPSGSNISKIQEHVAAFGKSVGTKEAGESKSQKKDPTQKKVQINHFIVKNGQVNLRASMLKGKALTVRLPDLHLRDIGKESGGLMVQQAAAEVLMAINKSVVQSVAGSGKLLGEAAEEAAKGLGSEAGKAVEGLKRLFK